MFTKTQLRILQALTAQIAKRFSIRQVAKMLDAHQALVYRAFKPLIEQEYVIKDQNMYAINYKKHHQSLAYIEHTRSKEFLSNHKALHALTQEIIEKLPHPYFVLCIFGSTVTSKQPKDTDILLIIERVEDVEAAERMVERFASNYAIRIHPVALSFEATKKLLATRDEKNVMNETLNKHFIVYGAELFYRLLAQGRS